MERQRILMSVMLGLVGSAALLLSQDVKADPICCSDVKFPEYHYGHGSGEGSVLIVDSNGGRRTYRSISEAINDAGRNSIIKVRPGTYWEGDWRIDTPLTIENDGGGPVIVKADGRCATVRLRREGKVAIKGIAFDTRGNDQSKDGLRSCIVVNNAPNFMLSSSDITVLNSDAQAAAATGVCVPSGGDGFSAPANKPTCGFHGVLVESGSAQITGNRIRRAGSAIAITSAIGTHEIVGNYLAGNSTGIFVGGGAPFVISRNEIFRNYGHGINIDSGRGDITKNVIEDNRTGLRIVPPASYRSASASYGSAADYTINVTDNLVTQFGKYRLGRPDPLNELGDPAAGSANSKDGRTVKNKDGSPVNGYALEFGMDSFGDGISDFPDKHGTPLSSVSIRGNCFFGPTTSWFDRDRYMPLIAPNPGKGRDEELEAPFSGGYKSNSFGVHKNGFRDNDAKTPLWIYDANTWVEHLDYNAVDDIDHKNTISSPLTEGTPFRAGFWTAIHNWFARNKKDIRCDGNPVLTDGGSWPWSATSPAR